MSNVEFQPFLYGSDPEPLKTEVICTKCSSYMTKGLALIGARRGITFEGIWPVRLRECLKCRGCGHSEVIAGSQLKFEIPGDNNFVELS